MPSTFFKVDQYFDFMIVNAENTTWHECAVKIKKQNYIYGYFRNGWKFYPNPKANSSKKKSFFHKTQVSDLDCNL